MASRDRFLALEKELNARYLERSDVIRGLVVGLLTREHVLLLGPPGTAKSEMTEDICGRIAGNYFRWLLSRTSAPEELFGPISIKALEQDSYRRVTAGKLPEANIVFLDEIFKCNSAVLNSLLTVLNERLFFNDGQPVNIPLEMVVGASNELPEDREELGALWDRFLLRYQVNYIRDPRNFDRLLELGQNGGTTVTISEQDLADARVQILQVDVKKVIPQIAALRQKTQQKNISVSDRRWRQCIKLIQAHAFLNGRQEAADDDLEILAACLWQEPGQINEVRQEIMALANPLDQEALDLLDQAMEIWQNALSVDENSADATAQGTEANTKLKYITKKLEALRSQASEKGKSDVRISEALAKVVAYNKEVIAKCLGITA